MPVLPGYQPGEAPNIGSTPRVDTGAEAIASGLGRLGAGVSQLGDVLEQRQKRFQQQQKFDAGVRIDQFAADQNNASDEAARNAPANGIGYHDGQVARFDKDSKSFLSTLSPEQRKLAEPQLQLLRTKFGGRWAEQEYKQRGTYEFGAINQSLEQGLTIVSQDPSQRKAVLDRINQQVDAASSISSLDKEGIRRNLAASLTSEEFKAKFKNDPVAAYRELGIPIPSELQARLPGATTSPGGESGGSAADQTWSRMVHQESRGNPNAVSPKGALGLTQLMPATAREQAAKMGIRLPEGDGNLRQYFASPEGQQVNLQIGRAYYDTQLQRYNGDPEAAAIAYNAGPGIADRWVASGRNDSVLPKETQHYVKVTARGGGGGADAPRDQTGAIPAPNVAQFDPSTTGKLAQYLVKGKDPSHVSGLKPGMQSKLLAMLDAAPPEVRQYIRIMSGHRSVERQRQLFAEAVVKYGSPQAARHNVAPPGHSRHNTGDATDLSYDGAGTTAKLSPAGRRAMEWVHQNAGQFGLAFPLGHEPWHVEDADARGGHGGAPATVPASGSQGGYPGATSTTPGGNPEWSAIPFSQREKLLDSISRDYLQTQAAQAAAQKQQIGVMTNNLQNLLIDGKAGNVDIESARREGWLSDADTVQKFRNIVKQRDEDDANGANFLAQLGKPGAAFNPFDEQTQKGADHAFKAMGGDMQALDTIVRGSGVVPKAAATGIVGALYGKDLNTGQAALQVASNIMASNANAFAASPRGSDIATQVGKYEHYKGLGLTSEDATRRVMAENDPAYKPPVKVTDVELKNFTTSITADTIRKEFNDAWFGAAPTISTGQQAAVVADFREVASKFYEETGDKKLAQSLAKKQLDRVYGVTSAFGQKTLMKYPPERAYPPVGDSHDYIGLQAAAAIKEATGKDIDPAKVTLLPIPRTTAAAFEAGKPVPYLLSYTDENGMQQTLWNKGFIADPKPAQEANRIVAHTQLQAADAWQVQNNQQNEAARQQLGDLYGGILTQTQPGEAEAAQTARAAGNIAKAGGPAAPAPVRPSAPPTSGSQAYQQAKEQFDMGTGYATD